MLSMCDARKSHSKLAKLPHCSFKERFNKFDITFFLFLYTSHTYIMSFKPIHYTRGANIHLNKNNFFITFPHRLWRISWRNPEVIDSLALRLSDQVAAIQQFYFSINFIRRLRNKSSRSANFFLMLTSKRSAENWENFLKTL